MDWQLLTCMHGVKEGLDSHDCPKCAIICRVMGHDHPHRTHIYFELPEGYNKREKEYKEGLK
jgi:hypothetical protein